MSLNIRKIPVFVFPNTLKFYLGSKTTHKQLLTLYNPYDFPVRFKVLCTAPNKYAVIDPEGSIGPHMLVDIIIRHIMPIAANCNITDKFRIIMLDHTTNQVLGKRDIEATLLHGERDNVSNDGDFHNVLYTEKGSTTDDQRTVLTHRSLPPKHSSNYVMAIITGLICIGLLLLPNDQEVVQPSHIPTYLHISLNCKLVAAYLLGLVSMAIFRPS